MNGDAYQDFDLQIHRMADGYRAQVLSSPAGQASHAFGTIFSDLELDNFLLRLGRPRSRDTRRVDSPESKAAKTLGDRLFTAAFGGDVSACLRSSLDQARQQGAGLRVRLRLTDVPELADLPWEYLYNQALNRFMALSPETPIVRYLDLPEPVRPLLITLPLRVLVMISSPTDYPSLDVERESTKLSDALAALEQRGQVVLERLADATAPALLRRLQTGQYHVLHFIGHGGFDQRAEDGFLVFEGDKERGRALTGQDLGVLLHGHRSMRLAVLNACEGARSSREDPFAGVAQSLIQQGIPAVVAMQFEITDEAAITFSQEFYAALADGRPVDGALAEARRGIFAQGNGLEWGTPVLYMRSPDGRIFDVEMAGQEGRQKNKKSEQPREPETTRTSVGPALTSTKVIVLAASIAALAWATEVAIGFAALLFDARWGRPVGGGLAGLTTGWALWRLLRPLRSGQSLMLALAWSVGWIVATRFHDAVSVSGAIGGAFMLWQLMRRRR